MRFNILSTALVALMIGFTPVAANATLATWQIIPSESQITFTAQPISGEFKTFSGDIYVDPTQLNNSRVNLVIDVNSLTTSYIDIANLLKSADWFDVKNFPQATFRSEKFTAIGDQTYQAEGKLTIHGKTQPLSLIFSADNLSKSITQVKGSFTISPTQFDLGQGEWANTLNKLNDDVKIKFIITAKQQN